MFQMVGKALHISLQKTGEPPRNGQTPTNDVHPHSITHFFGFVKVAGFFFWGFGRKWRFQIDKTGKMRYNIFSLTSVEPQQGFKGKKVAFRLIEVQRLLAYDKNPQGGQNYGKNKRSTRG